MLPQDLHIHTIWSSGDQSIVPEQTIGMVAAIRHARTIGISDHFEHIHHRFDDYSAAVRAAGLRLGMEINGHEWVAAALECECDYRIFHCYDRDADYAALHVLLAAGRPVIVAHPSALDTDLNRVPPECFVELNNRYIWRCNWREYHAPFASRFRHVIGSDAHQPNWLGQSVARRIAAELGIREHLLFEPTPTSGGDTSSV